MNSEVSGRILRRLRQQIQDGKYPLYSQLPPERALEQEFGVSRTTVRKALDVLEAEGRVWRHVGQGTFVGAMPPPTPASNGLGLKQPVTPMELWQAAMIIEPAIASHAAMAAAQADIDYMKQCLQKRDDAASVELRHLWDTAFHQAMAEATHNPVLVAMHRSLTELRQQPEWQAFRKATLKVTWKRESADYHRDILNGIAARNPQKAFEGSRSLLAAIRPTIDQPRE